MRRPAWLLGFALVLVLTSASGGAAALALTVTRGGAAAVAPAVTRSNVMASQARGRHHAPSRMLVYAQEWSLWPSRTSLPSGKVIVQLWNRGQDAHDLRVRRVNHSGRMFGRAQRMQLTLSGAISQASWALRPGVYELYCSMPGHLAHGMHVTVRVS